MYSLNLKNIIAVKWLIASKIKVFVYIIYVCTVYIYYVYLHLNLVILQTLLSKATYNIYMYIIIEFV